MDFRQTIQPTGNRPAPAPASVTPERKEERSGKNSKATTSTGSQWLRILSAILLVGVVVLMVGIILAVNRSNNDNESKFINTNDYQAVFLNNGQVYFGNIQSLTGSYVRMTNIYYLTQSSSSSGSNSSNSSNNNYSLVKLGCQQIHDPLDEMVINRSQVTFWENLNSNGKVVSSIKQFIQQNPNGPNCSNVSSQTQASNTNAQGSSNTNP